MPSGSSHLKDKNENVSQPGPIEAHTRLVLEKPIKKKIVCIGIGGLIPLP